MIKNTALILLLIISSCGIIPVYCGTQDTSKTIIIQDDKRTDLEKLIGKEKSNSDINNRYILPGGDSLDRHHYTAEQDSAYYRALKTKLPNYTRFWSELMQTGAEIQYYTGSNLSANDVIRKNLTVPNSYYAPSAVEIAQYQNNILQSMYVPFTPTYMPFGFKMQLNTIGMFLGIIEDVTPTISYKLESTINVEVVVYSIQAVVVQTIFKGSQNPGSYSLTWNLRDDKGRRMPPGDYIIEVRIGNYKYVRKRTVI